MSLPLFPDAGQDSLINFLNCSKDSSSLSKTFVHTSSGHSSSSRDQHVEPTKSSSSAHASLENSPSSHDKCLIQNRSSHSSSVDHHRYESRSCKSGRDQITSKKTGSPYHHNHKKSDESERSVRCPSSFSSSAKHHNYESRSKTSDEKQHEQDRPDFSRKFKISGMMESQDKRYPMNTQVPYLFKENCDSLPKDEYHEFHKYDHPTYSNRFGDDDSTIPTNETFDSTLTIEPNDDHPHAVPANINTYKTSTHRQHRSFDPIDNYGYHMSSYRDQTDSLRSFNRHSRHDNPLTSCSQNNTIADELRKQREVLHEVPIPVLYPRDQNISYEKYIKKNTSSPAPYSFPFKHDEEMAPKKVPTHDAIYGGNDHSSADFSRRSSGETPLTAPCSETTRTSFHNSSFITDAQSSKVAFHDTHNSGHKTLHMTSHTYSYPDDCQQHEEDARLDRLHKMPNMINGRPQISRPHNIEKVHQSDHMSHFKTFENRSIRRDSSMSHSSGFHTPTRCNKINAYIESREDVGKTEHNSRLAILKEIRIVLNMKQKAKMMEEEEEVQLLSRHLNVLNEELNRLSIRNVEVEPKRKELNKSSIKNGEVEPKSEDVSIATNDWAPIQTDPVSKQINTADKVPEVHHHTFMKSSTIKIRAPADLKAGYEFSANVNGKVIKACVVSFTCHLFTLVFVFFILLPSCYQIFSF